MLGKGKPGPVNSAGEGEWRKYYYGEPKDCYEEARLCRFVEAGLRSMHKATAVFIAFEWRKNQRRQEMTTSSCPAADYIAIRCRIGR